MQGKGSKNKGANGEREFASLLVSYGFEARRQGRQFFNMDGSREHQDVEHNVPGIHFEVKRCERVEIEKWIKQAEDEVVNQGEERMPVVAWRRNRKPWRVAMDADDFLFILTDYLRLLEKESQNESLSP